MSWSWTISHYSLPVSDIHPWTGSWSFSKNRTSRPCLNTTEFIVKHRISTTAFGGFCKLFLFLHYAQHYSSQCLYSICYCHPFIAYIVLVWWILSKPMFPSQAAVTTGEQRKCTEGAKHRGWASQRWVRKCSNWTKKKGIRKRIWT